MNIEAIREMVDRYLQGTATDQEKKFIEKWLQARPEDDQPLKEEDKQAIHTALWQSFTHRTNWQSFATSKGAGKSRPLFNYRSWAGYAAAAIVAASCAIWLNTTLLKKQPIPVQTITALKGAPKTIQLPDSSIAHLFPGATLAVPDDFNTKERAVTLSGKVFFEVKTDPSRPFYVQSGRLRTQVLGTSFEVTAQDGLHAAVIVRTGKVRLQYDGQQLADLIPGKRLRFDVQQHHFTIDEVNAAMLCEWWNNGMVFNQSPFEEVVQSISDWYNVPITITSIKWKQERVTIRIKNRSFSEALSLLSATLGFQYKKENNRIIIY
ncbi:FecR domain-containing protein [Chitinophaga sp. OAE865]|uniref:FecR family protein n=1 Tax=Chitinophaga sp. OAE865 TaxID=2817898 RepID=UPI001AE5E265